MDDNTQKPFAIYLMESEESWYVGSAWNSSTPRSRYVSHLGGRGGASKLWEAIQAGQVFTQSVLESGESEDIHDAYCVEEQWIHKYLADDPRECLNVNLYPSRRRGWAESPESIARRVATVTGRPNPKVSQQLKGRSRPDLSAVFQTPEFRKRQSEACKIGYANMTDEAKAQSNARRKATVGPPSTHCSQGHEFTEENTYTYPSGRRACRQCRWEARPQRIIDAEKAKWKG